MEETWTEEQKLGTDLSQHEILENLRQDRFGKNIAVLSGDIKTNFIRKNITWEDSLEEMANKKASIREKIKKWSSPKINDPTLEQVRSLLDLSNKEDRSSFRSALTEVFKISEPSKDSNFETKTWEEKELQIKHIIETDPLAGSYSYLDLEAFKLGQVNES